MALVRTAVTSPHRVAARGGPTSMGERRSRDVAAGAVDPGHLVVVRPAAGAGRRSGGWRRRSPGSCGAPLRARSPGSASREPCRSAPPDGIGHPSGHLGRPTQEVGQLAVVNRGLCVVVQDAGPTRSASRRPSWSPTVTARPAGRLGLVLAHQRAGRVGQGPEAAGGDLDPQARGHHLLQLVGLVEDHHVVLGQHGAAAGQVGSVEVGVDHGHVGRRRQVPGGLGKASVPRRAVEGPRTLSGADADHVPGPDVLGSKAEVGPVAALVLWDQAKRVRTSSTRPGRVQSASRYVVPVQRNSASTTR